jgi:hypothetical protein
VRRARHGFRFKKRKTMAKSSNSVIGIDLGKHVFSGAVFVSNFAFWLDTGYFDTAAEHKPLLAGDHL